MLRIVALASAGADDGRKIALGERNPGALNRNIGAGSQRQANIGMNDLKPAHRIGNDLRGGWIVAGQDNDEQHNQTNQKLI